MTRHYALDGFARERSAALTGGSPAVPHTRVPRFPTTAHFATGFVVLAQKGSHS